MGKEKPIQSKIMLHLGSKKHVRVFRNNVGLGFQGVIIKETPNMVVLKNHWRMHFGLFKGSSDLIGFVSRKIKPSDVGKTFAQFLSVECKSKTGKIRKEQENWIDTVKAFGGLAGIARSIDDAEEILSDAEN